MIRAIWAPKGKRPIARVKRAYEWLYIYAFANPQSGEAVFYLLSGVNIESFSRVLENLAQELGASKDHAVLLVLDRAGWHTSDQLRIPEGIELLFLPPYSPELQPAERLWTLTDEPLANRSFDMLDELEGVLGERCAYLRTQPDLITEHTLFHWWTLT